MERYFPESLTRPYDIKTKETKKRSTADDDSGGGDHPVYQTAIRRSGIFPDAACRPLPVTIFTQIYLTASKKGNGEICEQQTFEFLLLVIAVIVTGLNIALLFV